MSTRIRLIIFFFLVTMSGCATIPHNPTSQIDKQGYLILAPDRGYLGNQEILEVFQTFQRKHQSELIFINLYKENESQVSHAIERAIASFKDKGIFHLTAIPLTLSIDDPHIQKFKTLSKHLLSSKAFPPQITYAAAMAEDHRIGKILLDRISPHSKDPKNERLVIIGYGATTPNNEKEIRTALNLLLEEVQRYLPFKKTQILMMYHRSIDVENKTKTDKIFTQRSKTSIKIKISRQS